LRTTCAGIDCAVRVAEQVAVLRATFSVLRVLGVLPLGGSKEQSRARRNLGVLATVIRNASVVLGTVLASQASLVVRITVGAVWVDPEEVDVGRGDTDKEAEAVDRRSHGCG
jgi:hypothetical protein